MAKLIKEKKGYGELKRIDSNLSKQIQELADKNEISFKQASKEMAEMMKIKFSNKKFLKEIKF